MSGARSESRRGARRIVLASGNAHKVGELQAMAAAARLPIEVCSAQVLGGMPEVSEDTGTFVGNARKKARALWERQKEKSWVLADDSGLCVEALEGAPGVESAYYAGPAGDSRANLRKLIEVMAPVPDERRGAAFICVLLLIDEAGGEQVFEGRCAGRLARGPRGGQGFGYDPLFVPEGYAETYAELGDDVKGRISHRARAWAQFVAWYQARR